MTLARPSLNRDLFDDSKAKPFVRRIKLAPVAGKKRPIWGWAVIQRRNVETNLGIFISHAEAKDFAMRLWER